MLSKRLFNAFTLKRVGLSVGAVLLSSSPILATATAAQALPSWLRLGNSQNAQTATQRSQTANQTTVAQSSSRSGSSRGSATTTSPQNLDDIRFSCQVVNGQYTVMYNPQSQPGRYYAWATPTALGGGWSPERRCNEISRRLEFYRPDGLLELRTGLENGYNTVCVTTEDVSSCRIVLTVPPGQDPVAIRDRIFNNLLIADSGQSTTAVTAYQGGDNGILNQIGQAIGLDLSGMGGRRPNRTSSPASINLRPFLDAADGGTGTRLIETTAPAAAPTSPAPTAPAPSGGSRLNPGNFR